MAESKAMQDLRSRIEKQKIKTGPVFESIAKANPQFVGNYTNTGGKYLDMQALMKSKGYI